MDINELRALGFDVAPPAEPYYERQTLASAIASARERIEEWDYENDPHHYCHVRPEWIALVLAAEKWLEGRTNG